MSAGFKRRELIMATTSVSALPFMKYKYAPATRGQLIGIATAAILGAIIGAIMLLITSLSGHLNVQVWGTFLICELLAFTTGIFAIVLQLHRHKILIRAIVFTMHPKNSSINEALALRDALISSGDLDIAYRIQDALIELEAN
jgi:hypothetical protein